MRFPGAGDPVAAQPVHLQGEVELPEGGDDPVDFALGDVREQQVLLAGERDLRAERLEEVAEGDEPRTAEQAHVHGDADARQAVLRLFPTPRWSCGSTSTGGSVKGEARYPSRCSTSRERRPGPARRP